MKRIALVVGGAALLAGCGSSKGPAAYTKVASDKCFVAPPLNAKLSPRVDFVASTASQGAVHVRLRDNALTVLFGQDADEANNLAQAYRRFHAKNVGIEDILRVQNNAVMLWRLHPSDADLVPLENCLK